MKSIATPLDVNCNNVATRQKVMIRGYSEVIRARIWWNWFAQRARPESPRQSRPPTIGLAATI